MEDNKALIFNKVQGSFVDGWGVRTTIFLKGCPLKCKWCCNPEGQSFLPELKVIYDDCNGCGRCVDLCTRGALSMKDGKVVVDRNRCDVCGECKEFCYTGALTPFGDYFTVEEMFNFLKKDKMFYEASGGGVTIGGGEATWFPKFVLPLIDKLHEEGIQVAIDSSGYVENPEGKKILENADLVLFDIKGLDREKHKANTGVYNDLIWENLRWLNSINKPVIIRMPIIPGYNDAWDEIEKEAELLSEFRCIKRVDILPYHPYGKSKYTEIGMDYVIPEGTKVPQEYQQKIKALFESKGFSAQIGG
ncbi:MAG: glycyl-radical enzyme activating protein [Anaerovoracaceae bacterium]